MNPYILIGIGVIAAIVVLRKLGVFDILLKAATTPPAAPGASPAAPQPVQGVSQPLSAPVSLEAQLAAKVQEKLALLKQKQFSDAVAAMESFFKSLLEKPDAK